MEPVGRLLRCVVLGVAMVATASKVAAGVVDKEVSVGMEQVAVVEQVAGTIVVPCQFAGGLTSWSIQPVFPLALPSSGVADRRSCMLVHGPGTSEW
jgi:hypothetical protein